MISRKFGKWTIIGEAPRQHHRKRWLVRCDCGTERVHREDILKGGLSTACKECGLRKPTLIMQKSHGMRKHPLYNIWKSIHERCKYKKAQNYKWYGGRGITVCKRWDKFENFFADMGERPLGYQIDRINNDGNYEKSNCRWVTAKVNSSNKRNSIQWTIKRDKSRSQESQQKQLSMLGTKPSPVEL